MLNVTSQSADTPAAADLCEGSVEIRLQKPWTAFPGTRLSHALSTMLSSDLLGRLPAAPLVAAATASERAVATLRSSGVWCILGIYQ